MNLSGLLLELDKVLTEIFAKEHRRTDALLKTSHMNAAKHKSLIIDLAMEDTIINFFKEQDLPCVIEAEERGRTELSDESEFVIIADPVDGSRNLQRGIPLVCYGIAIGKKSREDTHCHFSDIQAASIRSFFTDEFFTAEKGKGAECNGKPIKPSTIRDLRRALISIDIDHAYSNDELISQVLSLLRINRKTRRFGANLLDMVYVGAGKLEAMIDLRGTFSVVHTPALFISQEAGAVLSNQYFKPFDCVLRASDTMAFILANNKELFKAIELALRKE